jgi:hypothetical protein
MAKTKEQPELTHREILSNANMSRRIRESAEEAVAGAEAKVAKYEELFAAARSDLQEARDRLADAESQEASWTAMAPGDDADVIVASAGAAEGHGTTSGKGD